MTDLLRTPSRVRPARAARLALAVLAVLAAAPLAPSASLALGAQQPAAADPGAARPIALAEAVQLAQRNAPAAVQARGTLRASEATIRSAYAAFIPSLSLNANTTQQSPASARVNQQTGELQAGRWAGSAGFNAQVDLFPCEDVIAARARAVFLEKYADLIAATERGVVDDDGGDAED